MDSWWEKTRHPATQFALNWWNKLFLADQTKDVIKDLTVDINIKLWLFIVYNFCIVILHACKDVLMLVFVTYNKQLRQGNKWWRQLQKWQKARCRFNIYILFFLLCARNIGFSFCFGEQSIVFRPAACCNHLTSTVFYCSVNLPGKIIESLRLEDLFAITPICRCLHCFCQIQLRSLVGPLIWRPVQRRMLVK